MSKFYIEVRRKLYSFEPNKVVCSGEVEFKTSIHDAAFELIKSQLGEVEADFWDWHYFDFVDVSDI